VTTHGPISHAIKKKRKRKEEALAVPATVPIFQSKKKTFEKTAVMK
jgi:hypothetical protein